MSGVSDTTRIIINIVAAMFAFFINACVGFFLSPYIVDVIGVEAQGFVQLATNFASYISIVSVALNAMAGRFITIEIHKGNLDKAGKFYTSVFYGNIFLFLIFLIPLIIFILWLEQIINIPPDLVVDVKILFFLSFLNIFVANTISLWNNTFFIVNKIHLQSVGEFIKNIFYVFLIFVLFTTLEPKIWYIGLASLILASFTALWGISYKNKFLPQLKVRKLFFSFKHLKEVISSGIWKSVQSTGELLLTGLDLTISNLLIDPVSMGVLAVSKIIPNMIIQFNWQIASTFAPQLTIDWVKSEKDKMFYEIKRSCKILTVLGTLPVGGLIVYGKEFFTLWMPTQNGETLHILSFLACFNIAVTAGIQPIVNVFTITNKVKQQAISVIISGLLNIILIILLLKLTNLGIYAIGVVSAFINLARDLLYTAPAAAKYLGFKKNAFYFGFGYSILNSLIIICIGALIKFIITPENWIEFILCCGLTGILGICASFIIVLNKNERNVLIKLFKKKRSV